MVNLIEVDKKYWIIINNKPLRVEIVDFMTNSKGIVVFFLNVKYFHVHYNMNFFKTKKDCLTFLNK